MLTRIRDWLRTRLIEGFWFPRFQALIRFLHTKLSLGYHFKRWLADGGEAPRGASELYQSVLLGLGLLWISLMDISPLPLLRTTGVRFLGLAVAMYPVTELLLFALQWTFVDIGRLHAVRRSLAGFLLNLFEIALYFSIAFSLMGCLTQSTTKWVLIYDNLRSVFTLQLMTDAKRLCCSALAHYQVIVAATLLVIVIASLIGAVVRKEKGGSD